MPTRSQNLAPFAGRQFRRLFVAEVISYLGSAATPVALSFAVLDRTHSPSALGAVNAANTVPLVMLVLFGGVAGDRLSRRGVLVGSNLVLGLARGAFCALILAGVGNTWELAGCAAVGGTANAFFLPVSQSVIPAVVPPDELRQANALLRLARNATSVLGGALGGLAVAAIGPGWALAWDAASYLVAAALFAGVTGGQAPARIEAYGVWQDLRLGWGEFWARSWLWGVVIQFAFVNAAFAAGFQLLGPVIARRSLGGATTWGFTLSALAVGYVLGGVIALRWPVRRPLLVGSLGVFTMAAPVAALASGASAAVVIAAGGFAGLGLEQFGVGWSTVMQEQIPLDRLSRVSSYDMLGSFVFIPVGYALGGPIAEVVGVRPTVWGSGVVIVVATAAVLAVRDVRTIEGRAASRRHEERADTARPFTEGI